MISQYVNPITDMIYAINDFGENQTNYIINSTANTIVQTYNTTNDISFLDVLPFGNPLTNVIYAYNGTSINYTLSIINGTTNRIINTIPLNGTYPLLEESTNRLYLFTTGYAPDSFDKLKVIVLDGSSGKQVDTISPPSFPNVIPSSYVVGDTINSKLGKLYSFAVDSEEKTSAVRSKVIGMDQLIVVDYKNNSVKRIDIGWRPTEISLNPITNRIYVTNHDSNTTSIIDGNTDKRINITNPDYL